MWGSDFPHTDSTWPNSQAVIEKNLTGVDDVGRRPRSCTTTLRPVPNRSIGHRDLNTTEGDRRWQRRTYHIISADGHVIEPPDMWTKYLPKRVPRPGPAADQGPRGRRRVGAVARARRRCRSAWSCQRGRVGPPVRGQPLVRLHLRHDPPGRVLRQAPPRGTGHRRRRRRGDLPLAAHHVGVHGPGGRRLPPRRAQRLQHLAQRGVHRGRPQPLREPGPDAGGRHRHVGVVAAGGQGRRLQGRDHHAPTRRATPRSRARTTRSGRRPSRSGCRSTSTSGCLRPASGGRPAGSRPRRCARAACRASRRWAAPSARRRGS